MYYASSCWYRNILDGCYMAQGNRNYQVAMWLLQRWKYYHGILYETWYFYESTMGPRSSKSYASQLDIPQADAVSKWWKLSYLPAPLSGKFNREEEEEPLALAEAENLFSDATAFFLFCFFVLCSSSECNDIKAVNGTGNKNRKRRQRKLFVSRKIDYSDIERIEGSGDRKTQLFNCKAVQSAFRKVPI